MHKIINSINLTEYKGLKISKVVDFDASEIIKVAIEKGTEFPNHISKTDVTLIVLEGKLSFFIDGQEVELNKHQVFQFPKNEPHSVNATENSKFLLIK